MSQVTDVAEKEIQEPMGDQVMTTEPDLRLCVFVVLFTFNKYSEFFCFSVNLNSCNSWTVEDGF